ncbi:MAG TPA: hypothetical protein ENN66_04140 [Proteobacteria bacterium]|nr:hypothetical protein [Pseudomonadota bacterium]
MQIHYQSLVRLLEKELEAFSRVAVFYETLAAGLAEGALPEVSELLAGGAASIDSLARIKEEKRLFLEASQVGALRDLLIVETPFKIRQLIGNLGSELVRLRRRIEESSRKIRGSLDALQMINRRRLDFFQQLCPAAIGYQGRGQVSGKTIPCSGLNYCGMI